MKTKSRIRKSILLPETLHVLEVLERALDGLEIGHHAAQPALVDVGHAAALGFLGDHLARLALGADHQDRAAGARPAGG